MAALEGPPPPDGTNKLALATIGFIKQTALFEQEYRRRIHEGRMSARDMMLVILELSIEPAEIVSASRSTINQCLEQLGGLDYFIDDKSTGRRVPCTYMKWHGVHPNDQNQHLWEARFPQGMLGLVVEAAFVDELASHVQANGN